MLSLKLEYFYDETDQYPNHGAYKSEDFLGEKIGYLAGIRIEDKVRANEDGSATYVPLSEEEKARIINSIAKDESGRDVVVMKDKMSYGWKGEALKPAEKQQAAEIQREEQPAADAPAQDEPAPPAEETPAPSVPEQSEEQKDPDRTAQDNSTATESEQPKQDTSPADEPEKSAETDRTPEMPDTGNTEMIDPANDVSGVADLLQKNGARAG